MGVPHSVPAPRGPTEATRYFTVDEIRELHGRFRQLVPANAVVFPDNFAAYCVWSTVCKPDTAAALFRAFDVQRRGFFDYEDFLLTAGPFTRGTPDQMAEVLFRMMAGAAPPASSSSSGDGTGATGAAAATLRFSDVLDTLAALDSTFLCLRCDGGVTAHAVAGRLPFDASGRITLGEVLIAARERL